MLPFNKPIKANKQSKKEQKNISKKTGFNFKEVINKVIKNKKTINLARDIQTVTHVSQTKHEESSQNTSGVHGSDVPGCISKNKKQNHCNSDIEPYVINED